jgi:hypothetical protein
MCFLLHLCSQFRCPLKQSTRVHGCALRNTEDFHFATFLCPAVKFWPTVDPQTPLPRVNTSSREWNSSRPSSRHGRGSTR